ncbi:MAG: hypothetical protein ACK4NC_07285, partial [Candidatus Gracilibacteria bacterium]
SAFPQPAYVWLAAIFDDSTHNQAFFPDNQDYVYVFEATPFTPTSYFGNINTAVLSSLNQPYKILAGALWYDTTYNDFVSIYSAPIEPTDNYNAGLFDVVFVGTSNRMGFEDSFAANTPEYRKTAKSFRFNPAQNRIEIKPYGGLYINGLLALQVSKDPEPTATTLQKYQDLLSKATYVRYRMYGIDALGTKTLIYTHEEQLNYITTDEYIKALFTYNAYNNTLYNNPTHFFITQMAKHAYGRRPAEAPKTLMLDINSPLFRNSAAFTAYNTHPLANAFIEELINYYNDGLHDNQTSHWYDATLWRSRASVHLVSNFTLYTFLLSTLFVHVAMIVPYPRFRFNNFYKNDKGPFGSDYKADFVKTEHNLSLLSQSRQVLLTGSEISDNNHLYYAKDSTGETTIDIVQLDYQPLTDFQIISDTPAERRYTYNCLPLDRFVVTLFKDDTKPQNIIGQVWLNALSTDQYGFLLQHQSIFAASPFFAPFRSYFIWTVYQMPDFGSTSLLTDGPLSISLTPFYIRVDKTQLQPGRYLVYLRAIDDTNRTRWTNDTNYDFWVETPQRDTCIDQHELDELRVPPPPPDFDISTAVDTCLDEFHYFCDEEVRFLSAFDAEAPTGITKYVFRNEELDRNYYIYSGKASRFCDFRLKDFCGVKIISSLQDYHIDITYNVRGRIDEVEIFNPTFQERDYNMFIRWKGALLRDTETEESVSYITAVTKEERSIVRRYKPRYQLYLPLYSSCALGQLLVMLKANYWVITSNSKDFAFRLRCIPREVKYEYQKNIYVANITLEESRWPGEFRFPLR